jgi:hypothetical protein
VAFWSERRTIPKEQVHELSEDGELGNLKRSTDIGGVFREIEVCAIMDIQAAKTVHAWLSKQINLYEKHVEGKTPTEIRASLSAAGELEKRKSNG